MTRASTTPDLDRPLHVLIVGAGIGGLCLAQGLRKAGVSCEVFERDRMPEERLQGYRLNIEPMGATALQHCLPPELWQRLIATAGDGGRAMRVFDEKLNCLMREDDPPPPASPADDTHAVSRRELRRLLLTGLDGHVTFGKAFAHFEGLSDGRIKACFADGGSAVGDLLVGADGINSKVRQQLLPRARVVRAGGVGIGGKLFLTPGVEKWLPMALREGKSMILPKRDFLFTALFKRRAGLGRHEDQAHGDSTDDGDYLMWAYVARASGNLAELSDLDPDGLRQRILQRMRPWSADLRRIVAETDPHSIGVFDFRTALPVRPWDGPAVTLLGDAIHAMPPVGGLGGNAALADAQSLYRAIVTISTGELPWRAALRAYEREMLQRGFATVAQARLYLRLAIFPSRLVRALARGFFKICGMSPALRRVVFGGSA